MASRSRYALAAVVVLGVVGAVASCGSNGSASTGGGVCTPGAQTSCACLGGTQGIQVCNTDGKGLGLCQCAAGTGGASTSSGSTSGGLGASGTGGGSSCQCTNPGGELYCGAAACSDGGSEAGTGDAGDGGTSCTASLTFAGLSMVQFGSNWSYGGQTGTAAGDLYCTMELGADHVCDYDDIVYATSKGELSTVQTTDNAWLIRTHSVTVGATDKLITQGGAAATVGETYKVGQASRCANWSYSTDHLNDGEWVDFSTGANTPTFHIDNNPCAIEMPNPGKDAPCGHNMMPRSILCCYKKNACNPAKPGQDCVCDTTTNTCM